MATPLNPNHIIARIRRRVLLHRRTIAAVLAGLTVYVVVAATQQPPPQTVAVWTAAHDLASGELLGQGDLVRRDFLPDSVPAGAATDVGELTGRILAAPAGAGEVVTTGRLIGRELGASYPGRRIVPVRLGDEAVAGLLRVGDEIAILAADPTEERAAEPLTEDAVVAGLPKVAENAAYESTGRLILVAVPDQDALRVASAGPTRFLIAIWAE
ncbi:MAG TPA: SAF domain-containing protein [Marmoricola sp.]|nr:SAF domain-containing protein [Marmoricola sp.]